MNEDLVQRGLMTRYLLGELSDAEKRQIEETYFADPASLEELLAIQYDLIDEFVQGRLNVQDHERFEDRIRSSPTLLAKVEFARALFQIVDSADSSEQIIPDAKPPTFKDYLFNLWSLLWQPLPSHVRWTLATAGLLT